MVTVSEGAVAGDDGIKRCWWGNSPPEYRLYHDNEWGRPVGEEDRIFEKLCLEGFQSGLSWLTVLRKREGFRRAFANFDPEVVARFGPADVQRLLSDASIIRHRAKIEAAIANAGAVLELRSQGKSLAGLVWAYEVPARAAPTSGANSGVLDTRIEGPIGAIAPPRLPVRRPHDRVRVDAVPRSGERPPPRLPCPGGNGARAVGLHAATVSPWTGVAGGIPLAHPGLTAPHRRSQIPAKICRSSSRLALPLAVVPGGVWSGSSRPKTSRNKRPRSNRGCHQQDLRPLGLKRTLSPIDRRKWRSGLEVRISDLGFGGGPIWLGQPSDREWNAVDHQFHRSREYFGPGVESDGHVPAVQSVLAQPYPDQPGCIEVHPEQVHPQGFEGLVVKGLQHRNVAPVPRHHLTRLVEGAQVVPALPYHDEVFPVEQRPVYERALEAEQPDLCTRTEVRQHLRDVPIPAVRAFLQLCWRQAEDLLQQGVV